VKLVVLASGEGSNLQAILDAIAAGTLDAEVIAVVANRKDARALARAEAAEISTFYVPLKPYKDAGRTREDYDRDLADLVGRLDPDWIVLAGWMHLFTPAFLDRFPGRVINLHPALPGAFPGKDGIGEAVEAWHRGEIDRTGCMVHVVVPEVDAGPVLATAEVPLRPGDTHETVAARMHAAEHDLIVDVLRALAAQGRQPEQ
jgi:formyltetrahydrofolate-dependent phosphoribosylglycinamide formyltransferase